MHFLPSDVFLQNTVSEITIIVYCIFFKMGKRSRNTARRAVDIIHSLKEYEGNVDM